MNPTPEHQSLPDSREGAGGLDIPDERTDLRSVRTIWAWAFVTKRRAPWGHAYAEGECDAGG